MSTKEALDALSELESLVTRGELSVNTFRLLRAALAEPQPELDELAEWRKLRDPVVLHVNLLRGIPAKLDRATFLHLAGGKQQAEPIAWESTTVGYKRFITEGEYQVFRPSVRAWYKPFRCSSCAQQAEPSADVPPEIGWLIEQEFGGGWLYWSGAFDTAIRHERKYLTAKMVRDPSEALRFARREDAQRALDGLLKADPCPVFRYAPEMYRVAEHQWG